MPNPWTGVGNPYTRTKLLERLHDTLSKGESIIKASAGSTAGLMSCGDANAIAMEISGLEVLPVVVKTGMSASTRRTSWAHPALSPWR